MTVDDLRAALAPATENGGGGVGPLLNARQVAQRLGVGPNAVAARLKRGTLPEPVAYDGGGRPLWIPSQIER